eukprot:TRINITY_DN15650_c0_g1_i1.p2 TRINITY_DN15650_c0_g1~~TRINITY_DN15650_c0_g1_i1.p2  ORF type:complete len:106 (+),score=18.34 TRINITY_DN15650_c0_g1_i1:70-387(+)
MGRRKSRRKVIKKKVDNKLPTTFKCPSCSHASSVECILNKKKSEGEIRCRICDIQFKCEINELTAPVDVYSDWLDSREETSRPQDEFGEAEDLSEEGDLADDVSD